MNFGDKLKQARTNMGLKQSELAKTLGTTNTTISNWEKGVSKPDLDMLSYICGALNVTASYFLQPNLPDDEVSLPELNMVKRYRALDPSGQSHVDAVLQWETERMKQVDQDAKRIKELTELSRYVQEDASHYVNAAHPIDGASEEDKQFDEDIMDDENF